MKPSAGSLARHGGITARASRGSEVGMPRPDPRGLDQLPCLVFNITVNTIGFGNVGGEERLLAHISNPHNYIGL